MATNQQMTRGKNRRPQEISYSGLFLVEFPAITLTSTITIGTLQGLKPLPFNVKIMAVQLTWLAGFGSSHAMTCNIVQGQVAKTTLATPDNTLNGVVPPTVATDGQYLFNADQSVTITTTAGNATLYPTETAAPDQFDAIFAAGSSLSFRVAGAFSTDSTTLYASAACVSVDIYPQNPQSLGPAAFAPAANVL